MEAMRVREVVLLTRETSLDRRQKALQSLKVQGAMFLYFFLVVVVVLRVLFECVVLFGIVRPRSRSHTSGY